MKTNKILAIGLLAAATVLTTGCSDSFLEMCIRDSTSAVVS